MQYGYSSGTDKVQMASMANWSVAEANAYCEDADAAGFRGTFKPPSKTFYPKCKLMLLRRAVPLRHHCMRPHHRTSREHPGGSQ